MKMIYGLGRALGLAMALGAIARIVDRGWDCAIAMVAYARDVFSGCYDAVSAKFKAELSYQADAQGVGAGKARANMVREGNGFRMASAANALRMNTPSFA